MAATAESAMPLEPEMPNLASPRVKAAMRVLGIEPQDLQKKELTHFGGVQPKHALFENKRRNLLHEVHLLTAHDAVGHGSGRSPSQAGQRNNAAFMDKVLEAEKRNMERMALAAKKEVQKTVVEELEAKLLIHENAKRQEASEQRLRRLQKERDDSLKAMRKEAQKRSDKNSEVRKRAEKHLEEEAQELTKKLHEAVTRAEGESAALAERREEQRRQSAEKEAAIHARQHKFEEAKLEERVEQYHKSVAYHEAKIMKLQDKIAMRHSHSDEILKKQQDSMERVRQTWEDKERETEKKYFEILERHDKAKERRMDTAEKVAKELRVKHTKARATFESRYATACKEFENTQPSRRLSQSSVTIPYERSLSDSQISGLRMGDYHVELVASNRERLSRAHQNAQEQQLQKLQNMRERVTIMLDAKKKADDRRMVMQRNVAVEKARLADEVFKVKSAPPEKMLKMLRELEPEPKAAARIEEILQRIGLAPVTAGDEAEK